MAASMGQPYKVGVALPSGTNAAKAGFYLRQGLLTLPDFPR
jgi:hypothetical protein